MALKPHHTVVGHTNLSMKQSFAIMQIAWSPDGTWMIGVGDHGMMCFFHRDKSAV
jgi:polycomb protein EED